LKIWPTKGYWNVEARNLINRLSQESKELPDVIAPVLINKSSVRVIVNNHPYRLYVEAPAAGWYVLRPTSSTRARVIREAEPFEIQECLRLSTSLRTIVMRRVTESRWLVFPFNLSDAQSKRFPAGPLEVFLVDQNLEPFAVVNTRLWGGNLLYDNYISSPEGVLSEGIEGGRESPGPTPGLNPEFRTVYSLLTDEIEKAKKATVEGRIKSAVEYLGAELVGFKEFGDGYSVEFRDHGRTFRTKVSGSLRLISAGICLAGKDTEQTLASSVAVFRRMNSDRYYNDYDNKEEYDD